MRALFVCLMLIAFNAQADAPTKCERNADRIKAIGNKYAGILYDTWRRAGRQDPELKLRNEAHWRAYYILRDNNMICKR